LIENDSTNNVIHYILFVGNTLTNTPEAYVIPLSYSNTESRKQSGSYPAWEELPEIKKKPRKRCQSINPSVFKHHNTEGQKCFLCSRGHKVGFNAPKCCAFGLAEEHLFEHFFDDLLSETDSCICSLSTLAEILPKLATLNQTTGFNSSSNKEEYVLNFSLKFERKI
jgi:hypothetical protein